MNKTCNVKHFIDLDDLDADTLNTIIITASKLKKSHQQGKINNALSHKTLAMIFDKPSTRTRISFEAGMTQLGGHALFLSNSDTQLGRNESMIDSSKVISAMVDAVMLRISNHNDIKLFAKYANIPTINALSDKSHPCQVLADLMTFYEKRGNIKQQTVAWVGDGNNMCQTYIQASYLFDFKLNIAVPKGYEPKQNFNAHYQKNTHFFSDAKSACTNADLVVTDVWTSMGQEKARLKKELDFSHYQVNEDLMTYAKKYALFMHCLPAYRGKEVTSGVIDSAQSVVFEAAENRLHVQKALLLYLFDKL